MGKIFLQIVSQLTLLHYKLKPSVAHITTSVTKSPAKDKI